jgi:hypothetical protein
MDDNLDRVLGFYERAFEKIQEKVFGPELREPVDLETMKLSIQRDLGVSAQAVELVRLALEQTKSKTKKDLV